MKTKRYFFGLPVVVLALGLVVAVSLALTGCGGDDGDGGVDVFAGTWIGTGKEEGHTIVAANGSYSEYRDEDGLEFLKGTYSVAGNTVTMKMVEVNPVILGGADGLVSWASLDDMYKGYLENSDTFPITIQGDSLFDDEGNLGFTRKK
jgi:hypothetical protein